MQDFSSKIEIDALTIKKENRIKQREENIFFNSQWIDGAGGGDFSDDATVNMCACAEAFVRTTAEIVDKITAVRSVNGYYFLHNFYLIARRLSRARARDRRKRLIFRE